MNVPSEAIQAGVKHLMVSAESIHGWLSDLGEVESDYVYEVVRVLDEGSIDVPQAVEEVLSVAMPVIRKQIADEVRSAAMTLTSGSIAEVARSVQRQAARIAEGDEE